MTCKRLVWNLGVLALSHWVNAKVLADAPRNRIVVPRPHQAKHFQKPNAPYSQKFANKQGSNFAAPAKPSKTCQNPFCRFDTVIPKDVSKYYTKNHTTRWHLYRLLLIVSLPAMWGSLDFNKTPRTHTHTTCQPSLHGYSIANSLVLSAFTSPNTLVSWVCPFSRTLPARAWCQIQCHRENEMPYRMPENVKRECRRRQSQNISDRMPGKMPDRNARLYAKKYVKLNLG